MNEPTCVMLRIPIEIRYEILSYISSCGAHEQRQANLVCKEWYDYFWNIRLAKLNDVVQSLDMDDFREIKLLINHLNMKRKNNAKLTFNMAMAAIKHPDFSKKINTHIIENIVDSQINNACYDAESNIGITKEEREFIIKSLDSGLISMQNRSIDVGRYSVPDGCIIMTPGTIYWKSIYCSNMDHYTLGVKKCYGKNYYFSPDRAISRTLSSMKLCVTNIIINVIADSCLRNFNYAKHINAHHLHDFC
jgi:hypothetical protein